MGGPGSGRKAAPAAAVDLGVDLDADLDIMGLKKLSLQIVKLVAEGKLEGRRAEVMISAINGAIRADSSAADRSELIEMRRLLDEAKKLHLEGDQRAVMLRNHMHIEGATDCTCRMCKPDNGTDDYDSGDPEGCEPGNQIPVGWTLGPDGKKEPIYQ